MAEDKGAVVDRWIAAQRAHDWEEMAKVYHPDAVAEWPQTGERVVGVANMRAIDEHYPGGLPEGEERRILGTGDRYVLDAMFVPRRVKGVGTLPLPPEVLHWDPEAGHRRLRTHESYALHPVAEAR